MNNTLGHWLIAGICCVEPVAFILVGIALHRRYQRHGLGGFWPKKRSDY